MKKYKIAVEERIINVHYFDIEIPEEQDQEETIDNIAYDIEQGSNCKFDIYAAIENNYGRTISENTDLLDKEFEVIHVFEK